MTRPTLLCLILLPCLFACSPKNEEVQDEQVEIAPKQAALDTVSSTVKDGVRTDENNTTPVLPMPQPVMQALQEKYPGWQKPVVVVRSPSPARPEDDSPALLSGHFNKDDALDYALQVQMQKELVIAAALSQPDTSWTIIELKRDKLFDNKGKLESLNYLSLLPAGSPVTTTGAGNAYKAPQDGVIIGEEEKKTVYILENGNFKVYSATN